MIMDSMSVGIVKFNCIIDFYVNKKQYDKYKTENGKKNFVQVSLLNEMEKYKYEVIGNVRLRDISIDSNDFWGNNLTIINDIGYKDGNPLPKRTDKLTIRVFLVKAIGIVEGSNDVNVPPLSEIRLENSLLMFASYKVV